MKEDITRYFLFGWIFFSIILQLMNYLNFIDINHQITQIILDQQERYCE